jgi:hypothetical protein
MLYKNDTKQIKQAGLLNVYWKSGIEGVNAKRVCWELKPIPISRRTTGVCILQPD